MQTRTKRTEGSALVVVLGVSMVLMLAGITLLILSRQSLHRIQRTTYYSQAQAAAEAGVADMVAKITQNPTIWRNATNSALFLTNGRYNTVSQPLTNGNVLITSDGIYMGVSNRTIVEILGTVQTRWNDLYNTNSAILSGGDVRFSTAAFEIDGDTHANQNVTSSSGAQNGTIDGDITACGTVGNLTTSGNVVTGAPPSQIPPGNPFNFDSYRQLATNGGVYFATGQTMNGTPISAPTNGILYINGSLTIGNNSSFAGTIVVNGNVTIKNHFNHTQLTSNMPAILCTGTITIENHTTLNGLIYAQVNVIVQNNTTINGGIISGGFTDISNSTTVRYGGIYPVWDPLNPTVPSDVIIGGWLK